jgi:hypothetical protein
MSKHCDGFIRLVFNVEADLKVGQTIYEERVSPIPEVDIQV